MTLIMAVVSAGLAALTVLFKVVVSISKTVQKYKKMLNLPNVSTFVKYCGEDWRNSAFLGNFAIIMKIIVAIDSFKGCLTSAEANQAAAEGIRQKMPDAEVIQIPVSDGGEGWLEAFQSAKGSVSATGRYGCD